VLPEKGSDVLRHVAMPLRRGGRMPDMKDLPQQQKVGSAFF
jgi:hypothetical protein